MKYLILLIIVGVGGWLLYRRFVKDAERVTARSKRERKERESGAVGTLVKDPVTGEYRLPRDED